MSDDTLPDAPHPGAPLPVPALYPALDLGPLPVALVNAVLGTELLPGIARLSRTAHRHMAKDHPTDYAVCFHALPQAIAAPTYIGQDPLHADNFELVKRVGLADGRVVLVAVGLEMNEDGTYPIRTSYLVPQRTVETRRQTGRLLIPIPR